MRFEENELIKELNLKYTSFKEPFEDDNVFITDTQYISKLLINFISSFKNINKIIISPFLNVFLQLSKEYKKIGDVHLINIENGYVKSGKVRNIEIFVNAFSKEEYIELKGI